MSRRGSYWHPEAVCDAYAIPVPWLVDMWPEVLADRTIPPPPSVASQQRSRLTGEPGVEIALGSSRWPERTWAAGGAGAGGHYQEGASRWERALVRRSPHSTATGASAVPAPAGGHRIATLSRLLPPSPPT